MWLPLSVRRRRPQCMGAVVNSQSQRQLIQPRLQRYSIRESSIEIVYH